MINSLSHKDEKCERSLINYLEHLHVTIQESSINDPKPSTSINNLTAPSFPIKCFKNFLNSDIDFRTSTINSNINSPYRFRKSTSMEHYYDEPTHVPSYQKKKYKPALLVS